jgi:transaldolase/glucose-6-phosphate isomerase
VSLEVSPRLANETEATIAEARRLWAAVNRPNVMIKVPGTTAGIPAIRQLIGEGININVTLLFSQNVYEAVANAYIEGLEHAASEGRELRTIASVASFFVSRIDSLIDGLIEKRLGSGSDDDALRAVLGKVAIANARLAYGTYQDIIAGDRWHALAERGAQTQRLLWASTGTKNPSYPPTMYVDELVGADTVNTVPVATLDQLREHATPQLRLGASLDEARDTMARLAKIGISMQDVTDQLVVQGVRLFAEAFDKLLGAIEEKRLALPA